MSSPFFPEMHDLAKLVNPKGSFPTRDGEPISLANGKVFANLDFSKLGLEDKKHLPTLQAIFYAGQFPKEAELDSELKKKLFLLQLAHRLASAFQVHPMPLSEELSPSLYKLWQPQHPLLNPYKPPINNGAALKEALEMATSWEKGQGFWERYSPYLRIRSDCDYKPFNIASLFSHSFLTSQFYKALEEKVTELQDPWRLSLEGEEAFTPEEAEQKWFGCIVWGQVYFYQKPQVPDDLKVFRKVQEAIAALEEAFPSNLIASFQNHFWLFIPGKDKQSLDKVAGIFLERGFPVTLRYNEAPLATLGQSKAIEFRIILLEAMASELERLKGEKENQKTQVEEDLKAQEKIAAELSQEIARLEEELTRLTSPKTRHATRKLKREAEKRFESVTSRIQSLRNELTELEGVLGKIGQEIAWLKEQLAKEKAEKSKGPTWYQEEKHPPEIQRKQRGASLCQVCFVRQPAQGSELCSVCQEIRTTGEELTSQAPWLSNGYLLWLHCFFEPRFWQHAILTLFSNYLDKVNPGIWEASQRFQIKTSLRWPVILKDFIGDLQSFLKELELEICRLVGARNRLRLADNLWVMPVSRGTKIMVLLRSYIALLEKFFPAFIPLADMPLYLGMSIAPASEQFFAQWRYLRRPPQPISIKLPDQERLEVSIDTMKELIRYGEVLVSYRQRRRPSLEQVRIEELIARNIIKRQDVKTFQQLMGWEGT